MRLSSLFMFEVYVFVVDIFKCLKWFLTHVISMILLHSTKILALLNLGVGFFSVAVLVMVEERLRKVDVVLQKYEAKLAEKAVEVPVVAERSLDYVDYGLLTVTVISILSILFLAFIIGTKPSAPANGSTKFLNSSMKEEVVSEFVEPLIPATLGETDTSLVELASTNPSTLISETLVSPAVPELLSAVVSWPV